LRDMSQCPCAPLCRNVTAGSSRVGTAAAAALRHGVVC
jgi:hypothetical protein